MIKPTVDTKQPEPDAPSRSTTISLSSTFLYLRVSQASVLPISTPADPIATSHNEQRHFYVIKGEISHIRRIANTSGSSESDWLLKVAQLVFDPLALGRVFTHRVETVDYWRDKDMDPGFWDQVSPGQQLLPKIYEYTACTPISISKMSLHGNRSTYTAGTTNATTFRRDLERREGNECFITSCEGLFCIASHFVPKRLGDSGAQEVVQRFLNADADAARGIHKYSPVLGALAFKSLDMLINKYDLGFYHVTGWNSILYLSSALLNTVTIKGNEYILHNFDSNRPTLTLLGPQRCSAGLLSANAMPLIIGFKKILEISDRAIPLPPPGVFNWHYLQCVLRYFATEEYKAVEDHRYHIYPFKITSASSDEENLSNGDLDDPPYPSYRWESALQKQWAPYWDQEERKRVSEWASGVPVGLS